MLTSIHGLAARALGAVALLCVLGLSGCGNPASDPTVSRSEAQSEQLRERLRTGQGAN